MADGFPDIPENSPLGRALDQRRFQREINTQIIRQNNNAQSRDLQIEHRLICVNKIQVNSPDELHIGDHVIWHRRLYDHHGIITEKTDEDQFQVTEATNTGSGFFSAPIVGGNKANLKQSLMEFNFGEDRVSRADYETHHRLPKPDTASLATNIYCESNNRPESYEYNLITNNCEHFATYCATGKMYSLQVAEFVSNGLQSLIRSIFIPESRRNNKTCIKCVCLPYEQIKSKNDVKEGDSIMYVEEHIWHHAVVIKTEKPTNTTMKCLVAHHNSCSPISPKTIETKDIVIRFKNHFYIVKYASPSSGISEYGPKDVQKRARTMIGKKFSVNECTHFPIWCKVLSDRDGLFTQICKTFVLSQSD